MIDAIRNAMRHARFQLAEQDIHGDVIIELELREWNYFKRSLPTRVHMVTDFDRFDGSPDSCQFEGGIVRLKRRHDTR